mmetsp:Transcript_3643/g.9733  ORF Transcript_3643/g.9733 Transcript_3643/m.9733 type:complete len:80 (+) Transcript_3643:963-1202(+)
MMKEELSPEFRRDSYRDDDHCEETHHVFSSQVSLLLRTAAELASTASLLTSPKAKVTSSSQQTQSQRSDHDPMNAKVSS